MNTITPPATPSPSKSSLAVALSSLLPSDLTISVYHIASTPAKTDHLFTPPPCRKPAATSLESHFVAISHDNVLAFAIELLVYTLTATGERIIFISKADSSGYLPSSAATYSLNNSDTRISLVRSVATTAVRCILDAARAQNPHAKITLNLFARAQSQYLFPNSAANSAKHVLEDQGLIAWWCRVLDPVYQRHIPYAKAYCLVPGFDRAQTRRLLPNGEWICGHPLRTDPERDITVREIIPWFPDDPKARFLMELDADGDSKRRSKQWANIKTVDVFWDLMSMRQECSLGRCVGFIWVVVEGEKKVEAEVRDLTAEKAEVDKKEQLATPEPTHNDNQSKSKLQINTDTESKSTQTPESSQSRPTDVTSPSSPQPCPASRSPNKRSLSNAASMLMSPRKKKPKPFDLPITPPLITPAIVLDEKRYDRTVDALLNHTDFGTLESARTGTRKWIQGAYAVVKSSDVTIRDGWNWGEVVTGTATRVVEAEKAVGGVNVLPVRKRTKEGEKPSQEINTLTVRKREKPAVDILSEDPMCKRDKLEEKHPVINVLGAGLVRKREKPA
ncbi:histone acetylation protein-domain-containing protein [Sphaerosporella brunnea]|uniref:histone acetyltransferase n=1 Tax=Sphaerosporella brunnea TaxID=1250544 RepID=A0A5J5EPI3_9PEZI|nr:histone acetylation protein-domain-containing protein [Sphaerosporella brunnea]